MHLRFADTRRLVMGDEPGNDLEAGGGQISPSPVRRWVALSLLAVLAGLAWTTMGPGKIRVVVLVLLLAFVLRIVLTPSRSGGG